MSGILFGTVKRAVNWLESLEPVEIIEVLNDYPGTRHSITECVLARYCKETTGQSVKVSLEWIHHGPGIQESVRLGEKLHSFRVKFDDGDYPQLELEEDEG